jgi:hypothetical protein
MLDPSISTLFDIQSRYIRSINLEKDFTDPSSLEGYVITPQVKEMLLRLRAGLDPRSSQRAWRITGDYGSGKSSFALLLAHLFGGKAELIPAKLKSALRSSFPTARLLPVLVTGTREPLGITLLAAVARAVHSHRTSGPAPQILETIERLQKTSHQSPINESQIVDAVLAAADYATRGGRSDGLLIVLDELGKSLEYSALHPEQQDVYLLQRLAEIASRSGKRPIYIVGLLHQGFNAYAESLSQSAQREWEKVAGRFDEIIFSQPLDQIAYLIAEALRIKSAKIPKEVRAVAEGDMEQVLDLGWYGPGVNRKSLTSLACQLYPIHPTVIPVLVRLFSRFGQNERSLFSFLLSNEPFGLQAFAEKSLKSGEWFRLNNLFDYTRIAFGHRLGLQSYRSHWNQIDSVIESYPAEHPDELEILKCVGLLNLVDTHALSASVEVLRVSCELSRRQSSRWKSVLEKLQRQKRVLYFRGQAGGFCLWPHTSVNLEKAYEDACSAIGPVDRVSVLLGDYIESRPIVARRHYIQTGNLRHFSVQYTPVSSLRSTLSSQVDDFSDGRIIVTLCDTQEDRRTALAEIESLESKDSNLTLIAVPRPLNVLVGLVQEVQRWNWIMTNTPELNHDRYAANEVSRQLAGAQWMLKKAVLEFVGLQQADRPTDLQWFRLAVPQNIKNGKQLLAQLSSICDECYSQAPQIRNELVNRRQLSSAAAAARMRLIERLFSHSELPRLGMAPDKTPPETSMYLSVLVESHLHQIVNGQWCLAEPGIKDDSCNVLPTMKHLLDVLRSAEGRRIRLSEIVYRLRRPPYGVRDGLAYLLLAIFAQIREQDLAFYENGSFMRNVGGEEFLRIVKEPTSFEIQFYEMNTVRSDLYRRLTAVLQLPVSERGRVELLDVVRPLCQFASKLPVYTQKTSQLDVVAINVRRALLEAREPALLLFEDIPKALSFLPEEALSTGMDAFIGGLKDALESLRLAYSKLLERIDDSISQNFQVTGARAGRLLLRSRAEALLISASEPRLRAFCIRLADESLGDLEWLEALASLACAKPPAKWLDKDQELFERELNQLAAAFTRLESLLFSKERRGGKASAFRVAITQQDGFELERVVYVDDKQKQSVIRIESEIIRLIRDEKSCGEAALATAFWQVFSKKVVPS